jgi:SAM-dependent methyltransferase
VSDFVRSDASRSRSNEEADMTETGETFQLTVEAAEAYEANFVPALFAEWARYLADAAAVQPGQRVLDVACGTGIVARTAAMRLAGTGSVAGTDLNDAMLSVAARLAPEIEWRRADAASQPFADGSFDVVLCQAALMFLPDRVAALREMRRVATKGGTVAIQVWDQLAGQPAYGPLVEVAAAHAGPEAVDLLSSYWVAGDPDDLRGWCAAAGLSVRVLDTRLGTAHFPSLEQVVRVEVESTPLRERISDATYDAILADAVAALASYETPTGAADIPISGHLVVATA